MTQEPHGVHVEDRGTTGVADGRHRPGGDVEQR
jgi:hypothetical protein